MEERLPEKVDVVVLGTGLPESIVAAACARTGLTVLHMDRSDFYGGEWASFNLHSVEEWVAEKEKEQAGVDTASVVETHAGKRREGERVVCLGRQTLVRQLETGWMQNSTTAVPRKEGEDGEKTLREAIEEHWRRFSIDLAPKALLARGAMVQTLCDSEVSRYAEFKMVDRFLCMHVKGDDCEFSRVPCSRSEIFESQTLSMMDKRRLMKFMQFCLQWNANKDTMEEWKEFALRPFSEFLSSQGISGELASYVSDSIGILAPGANTEQGLCAVCRFVDSVGRFGASPFLSPLYGCGELPQCFCRLCAVFGGVYCLGRPVEALLTNGERVVGVVADGQRVDCDHVIINSHFLPDEWMGGEATPRVARAAYVTTGSMCAEEKERISLLSLSSLDSEGAPRLFEAGFECCNAPKGYYVAQLTAQHDGHSNVREKMDALVAKLYNGDDAAAVWRLSYSLGSAPADPAHLPGNVAVVSTPSHSLDYNDVIAEAQSIFARFWPDHDFLPRSLKNEEGEEEEQKREETEEQGGEKEEEKDAYTKVEESS